ncbi:hypothetical protein ACSF6K_21365 [Escherichia coli]|uniref:hypothetical protein n=1 Tax=Escherichia coli TaxID=562 RepID=UPI003EEA2760
MNELIIGHWGRGLLPGISSLSNKPAAGNLQQCAIDCRLVMPGVGCGNLFSHGLFMENWNSRQVFVACLMTVHGRWLQSNAVQPPAWMPACKTTLLTWRSHCAGWRGGVVQVGNDHSKNSLKFSEQENNSSN